MSKRQAPRRGFQPPVQSLRPRRDERVKCPTGKRRYASAIDAGIALGNAQRNRLTRGVEVVEQRHYLCNLCQGHHLTSKPMLTERRTA